MMPFLEELASRRRFGMKPGLETICETCRRLGNPQRAFHPIHVAGTNGKGAVCAILDACLGGGRYTSPHLVSLNERFFLHGAPIDDSTLETAAAEVAAVAPADLTFFEALTAVAFLVYSRADCGQVVFETGLGGRLDATNACEPRLTVITRIGLEHCDWLGDSIEKIAAEKAGIVKTGVPIVLGRNEPSVREIVKARAREVGAPFFYAPDIASESEIPADFSLSGAFNRENAVTALAALAVLLAPARPTEDLLRGFGRVVWPGRFHQVGRYVVDGAHNPPAARALAAALEELRSRQQMGRFSLVAGFCGDKDVEEVLRILTPQIGRAFAVRTNNPRSLSADEVAAKMTSVGLLAEPCASLEAALHKASAADVEAPVLICGSLFLAGEALVELKAYPWSAAPRFDASELLKT